MTEAPPPPPKKWYYTNWSLAAAFITVGPLALPLVWKNPGYTRLTKWVLSVVMIVTTVLLCVGFGYSVKNILAYYRQLSEISGF